MLIADPGGDARLIAEPGEWLINSMYLLIEEI
jgi:hypothetical protein